MIWKETLDQIIELRAVEFEEFTPLLASPRYQDELRTLGEQAASSNEPFLRQEMAAGSSEEAAKEALGKVKATAQQVLFAPLIEVVVRPGYCHEAFAYAAVRCEFMYARPWRNKYQLVITKAEMLLRQKE
jgi:hypothetical protein